MISTTCDHGFSVHSRCPMGCDEEREGGPAQAVAAPTYVEDGRPCEITTVAELLPGDEILGWQGEPFTFGTVDYVERVPRPTYSGEVRHSYLVHVVGTRSYNYVDGGEVRRIARRAS